jgi:hypothetical protein
MSFLHGKATSVYLGAVDLSTYLNSAEVSGETDTADSTTFKATWKSALAGNLGGSISAAGLYDPDETSLPDLFLSLVPAPMTVCPGAGATLGDAARLASVYDTSHKESSPVGGVVAISATFLADGTIGFGRVIHVLSEETSSGNGTAVDMTAQTTTGGIAQIHATAVTATDTFDITIEDSANGTSGWATIGTFSSITAAGAERIVIAGTIKQYLRVVTDVTDVSGTPAITFVVALART